MNPFTTLNKELKPALTVVWIVISLIIVLILLFPVLAERETVLQHAPTCVSKSKFNKECSLCGMTSAFIEISNGNISAAERLNSGSPYLYLLFIINTIFFFFFAIRRLVSKIR